MPRVLLVEDDPNECLLYAETLRGDGYDVLVANDGHQAITLATSHSPDIVVMDVSMPGMDGIDAMGRILARNNKVPIILNTAYASYKEDFRAWSADAYVVKSSDLSELKETIRRVLQARTPAK